jgi:tetratricopeptide (TPR) repeat protein
MSWDCSVQSGHHAANCGNSIGGADYGPESGFHLERYKDTDSFAVSLVTLSRLHMDNGDTARAETILQRALRSVDNLGQGESPTRALIFGHLGVLYGSTGRHSDAESYFQRAIEMNRRVLGPAHSRVLDTMGAYADFLRATKRKGEAKKVEEYVRTQRENYRLQNPSIASVVDVRTLMRQGDRRVLRDDGADNLSCDPLVRQESRLCTDDVEVANQAVPVPVQCDRLCLRGISHSVRGSDGCR